MATAADVDLRGWTVQGFTPRRDGNFPASVRSLISLVAGTNRTSGAFPLGVMFDASDTTSPGSDGFESLRYEWDYDDAGSTFTNAPDTDATTSVGPIGAHVYTAAGTYNPSLTVTDKNGDTETTSFTITVTDPADFDEVYYVSTSGTYPGGVAADKKYTTFAEVATLMNSVRNSQLGNSIAVLFRAGESFSCSAGFLARENSAPIYIGRYDSGADPIIAPDSSVTDDVMEFWESSDITIANINFQGLYDPTTGLGAKPDGAQFLFDCTDILIYQCTASGLGIPFYMDEESSTTAGTHMVVDCSVADWQNFGLFGAFGELSCVLGNSVRQNASAVSGSEGKVGLAEPNYPDHGPIRTSSSQKLLIQNNDMFNNCGWSSNGLAHQACIRMGTATAPVKSVVSDNTFEGGFSVLSSTQANPSGTNYDTYAHIIWERNVLTATANSESMFSVGHYGHIIRNNMFYKPDNGTPPLGSGQFRAGIQMSPNNADPASIVGPTKIYNNTLISQATDAADTVLLQVLSDWDDYEVHNNIVYLAASNGNSGLVDFYSGDVSGIVSDNNIIYSPSSTNYAETSSGTYNKSAWETFSSQDTNSSTSDPNFVSNTSKTGALNVGSPAIDNAKDLSIAIDDLNKTLRSVPYNIGVSE